MTNLTFRQTLKRYLRFGMVGASGVVVDMGMLYLLADPKMLGLNLSLSKAIAAEVAIVNNFAWNELWTFGDLSATQSYWDRPSRSVCQIQRDLSRWNWFEYFAA